MQNYSKSIANALDLLQSCTKPSVRSYGLTLVVLNFSGKKTHEKKYLHCFSTWNGRRMLKITLIENKSIQIAHIIADFHWISLSFRTHPCVLAFITHVVFITEFSWLFYGGFVIHLVLYFSNMQYSLLHWWILVKHAIQRDTTWRSCGGRCCCYAATIVTTRNSIMTLRGLNVYCDVTQYMNG